jgi:hypothetical protein
MPRPVESAQDHISGQTILHLPIVAEGTEKTATFEGAKQKEVHNVRQGLLDHRTVSARVKPDNMILGRVLCSYSGV